MKRILSFATLCILAARQRLTSAQTSVSSAVGGGIVGSTESSLSERKIRSSWAWPR